MPVVIRQAGIADAAMMPGIEQSAGERFRTLADLAWLADERNLDKAHYRALVAGGWCWIAEDIRARPCAFLVAEAAGHALHLCEIGVVLERQGQGIGRALLQTAIQAATQHGFAAMTLTTFIDVAWNAPFYARLGFHCLATAELDPRLQALLRREAEAGLPRNRRCAMRLTLPQGKQA